MKIFNKIKTYLFAAEMFVSISIVIVLMFFFRKHNFAIRRNWARLQVWLLGCEIQVEGEVDLKSNLVLANHQSMLDIIVMLGFYPKDLAFVAKKEIGDLFFFGQTVKLTKMILIDRQNPHSLKKMMSDCARRVSEGRTIFLFPEGTRGGGEKLLPFKNGARMMAQKLSMRVQPVVLVNTRAVMDSQKFELGSKKAWVKVIYLSSVDLSQAQSQTSKELAKTQPQNEALPSEWFANIERQMNEVYDKQMQILNENA